MCADHAFLVLARESTDRVLRANFQSLHEATLGAREKAFVAANGHTLGCKCFFYELGDYEAAYTAAVAVVSAL